MLSLTIQAVADRPGLPGRESRSANLENDVELAIALYLVGERRSHRIACGGSQPKVVAKTRPACENGVHKPLPASTAFSREFEP
jgi:hypothetical protein